MKATIIKRKKIKRNVEYPALFRYSNTSNVSHDSIVLVLEAKGTGIELAGGCRRFGQEWVARDWEGESGYEVVSDITINFKL